MPHQVPCVYILRSEKNGEFYIGSTVDLIDKIRAHQAGKAAATKGLRPLQLCLSQVYPTLAGARRVEKNLKNLKSKAILQQIIAEGIIRSNWELEPA